MSAWETIEFQLSRLHSYFLGDPDGDATRAYGEGRIFPERMDLLTNASERFFVKNCSQGMEGEFCQLKRDLLSLADRRNEVAHSIIFNIAAVAEFSESLTDAEIKQYAIIAPYYSIRQHDEDGLPAFAYTSESLEALVRFMAADYRRLLLFCEHVRALLRR